MIDVHIFAGQPVAVMGLGRSGLSAARALAKGGADVWAWDDNEGHRQTAAASDINVCDPDGWDWQRVKTLVLSPGIPATFPAPHPTAQCAMDAGAEIICDVDLLAREVGDARYVGVTGTNGKSTTTALIGHIFEQAGRSVQVGGNLGTPVLDLDILGADGAYVLELSSYQLERVPSLTIDIAVLINISPDHLDRHGGMEGYVAAKRHLFDHPAQGARAVVGMDDHHSRELCLDLMVRGDFKIIPISASQRVPGGVYAPDGRLIDDMDNGQAEVLDLRAVGSLPGQHNWQNAAAAYAAARAAGIAAEDIVPAIKFFPGLAHRQERIRRIGRVTYINDSKATNIDAAARALACYGAIHWIAGGRAKQDDLTDLEPYFGNIRRAYLIGEAALPFAASLDGKIEVRQCGDLTTAVNEAHAAAQEADEDSVVLLSPACASFDQFDNFEQRGDTFRTLVEGLA